MIWTATKIDHGTFCIRKLWYLNIRVPRHVPPATGPQTRGIFLHKFIEKFYKKDKSGIIVPKFKSADAFVNTAVVRWNYIVSRGTIQNKQIKWKDKKEPWILREEIKKICKNIYEKYSQEEPPLFTEVPSDFKFDGRHYRIRIDEIRKGKTLRDIKFSHRTPEEVKLLVDPQFTLYLLGYMVMGHEDREFAKICGVSLEEVEKWMGNPNILSENINLEYCLIRDEGIKIYPTKRNNNHYYDFCNMLQGLEKQIEEEQWKYVKRGRNCAYCDCNELCIKEARLNEPSISPEKGRQLYLFSDVPRAETVNLHRQLRLRFPQIKKES